MLPAELNNFLQVRNMGSDVLGENQNVIHIDKTEGGVSKNLKHSLEPLACISQAKRKPEELTHTKGGDDVSLLDVKGRHRA